MNKKIDLTGAAWFKSSYSTGSQNCVEVAFIKSSYSNCGDNCVEVASTGPAILLRDSKAPALGTLTLPALAFTTFIRSLGTPQN